MTITHPTDTEQSIAHGWAVWEATPPGADRDQLRNKLWQLEDFADDDLIRDMLLDAFTEAAPESMSDLLAIADRVIEVA